MIAYTVTITTKPGCREHVMRLLGDLVVAAADEPGTLVYAFHAIDGEPDTIVSYELYADDDALATHQSTSTVARVLPEMEGLVAGTLVRRGRPVVAKGLPDE
jgi:quinol monooxygenase YgiN